MFTVGVVAHTARSTQAHALARTVHANLISVDNGVMGCDSNHETVIRHLCEVPSTWTVVLEDDAEPVEDFRAQLNKALIMAPAPIVSLYYGRQRPPHWEKRKATALMQARAEDAHWIIGTHLLHAVGYAIRTELLPSLLKHASTLPVDQHITDWAKQHGHMIAYTAPFSLVDHADGPTIVDHPDGQPRRPGRKAYATGTRDHWTTKAVMLR
jgi:GR25 family glycosyltransferase involved in LPS biosynthesis